jgi:hypothetical protein
MPQSAATVSTHGFAKSLQEILRQSSSWVAKPTAFYPEKNKTNRYLGWGNGVSGQDGMRGGVLRYWGTGACEANTNYKSASILVLVMMGSLVENREL